MDSDQNENPEPEKVNDMKESITPEVNPATPPVKNENPTSENPPANPELDDDDDEEDDEEKDEAPKKDSPITKMMDFFAKLGKKKPKENEEDKINLDSLSEADKKILKKEERAIKISSISKIVAFSSFIVPILSFLFYNVSIAEDPIVKVYFLDTPGQVLKEKKTIYKAKSEELQVINNRITWLNVEIKQLSDNKVLTDILNTRINWLDVITRIENITNETFNKYDNTVSYSAYSGSSGTDPSIVVTGEVRDPGGKSMSQLIDLIDVFNEDPHFTAPGLRSFSKTENPDGSAVSNFNLSFEYKTDLDLEKEAAKNVKK